MYYNLINNLRSKPFPDLITAQTAAHDFVLAAFDLGLSITSQTIDDDGKVITEFKVIEIVH